jgi:hypothetical protein
VQINLEIMGIAIDVLPPFNKAVNSYVKSMFITRTH